MAQNTPILGKIKSSESAASLDAKYGPYASKAAANAALGENGDDVITAGLTVGITQPDGSVKEFWYQPDGKGGLQLVEKQVAGGTEVEANPSGEATAPLNKIKIGETNYNIPEPISDIKFVGRNSTTGFPDVSDPIEHIIYACLRASQDAGANSAYDFYTLNQGTWQNISQGQKGDGNFTFIKYSENQPTQDSDIHDVFSPSSDKFVGFYNGTSGSAPSDYEEYTWCKFMGTSPEVTIESITGGNRVTITDEANPSGQSFTVLNGADAVNPFKGWFTTDKIPTTGQEGDYCNVSDTSVTPHTVTIYRWNTTLNRFVDTGEVPDTANGDTFANGEELNQVAIDKSHLVNPVNTADSTQPVLAQAYDVMQLNAKLQGVTASELKVTQTPVSGSRVKGDTGILEDISGTAYIEIEIGDIKSIRFLGAKFNSIDYKSGYAFGHYTDPSDENSWVTDVCNYFNKYSDELGIKEYVVIKPSISTHFRTTTAISQVPALAQNFYCYLQKGDDLVTTIQANTNEKANKSLVLGEIENCVEGACLTNIINYIIQGNSNRGITPLIPVSKGQEILLHGGFVSRENDILWCYNSNKEPISGQYYYGFRRQYVPLTTPTNVSYIRATFVPGDNIYITVDGIKVWEYKKRETGLAEWKYKSLGIDKTIYDVGQIDSWAKGYVHYNTGNQLNSTVNSCTGFIDIGDFETIETIISIAGGVTDAGICFYNESGTFISGIKSRLGSERSYEQIVLNKPLNAKYARFSIYNEFTEYWYLIGKVSSSQSGSSLPQLSQKVTLEFGSLNDSDGQMKPYSSDFFDNARTPLYYKLSSINLPYSYTLYEYNSSYGFVDIISCQPNVDYELDVSKWYKIVINYTVNNLPKKEIVIDLDVIAKSYNIITAKTIKTFEYAIRYKKGRGLYVDGDTDYSEAASFEDTLISNTIRVFLPANYSPTGEPVKLMYKAHGTGGYPRIDTSDWGGDGSISFLADEGFAIYDMFAGTSYYNALTTNRIANYNLPIQLAAQKAAYEWIVRNFNVDHRIYVVGKSHGGLAGIYATNNIVPTRAVALLAPLITQIADRYSPWGLTYESECSMCLDDMCFIPSEGMTFDEMVNIVHTQSTGWKDILLNNIRQQSGLNPYINGVTNVKQETLLTNLMDSDYKTIGGMDGLIRHSDVPVKIWCAVDDDQVVYANGYNWIKSLQNGGSNAQFRTFPEGYGRHSFDSFTNEASIKDTVTTALGVTYTASRAYIEVVNFLNQF